MCGGALTEGADGADVPSRQGDFHEAGAYVSTVLGICLHAFFCQVVSQLEKRFSHLRRSGP